VTAGDIGQSLIFEGLQGTKSPTFATEPSDGGKRRRSRSGKMVNPVTHWAMSPNPHDIIQFSFFEKASRIKEIAPLYKKGLSLREIEQRTGISKTTLRKELIEAGVDLRSKSPENLASRWRNSGKRNIKPPYGFCYFEGRITRHPKEYPVLLAIIKRWKSGQPTNSIAKWLNGKAVPSPMNKEWSWNSITNIIQRIQNGQLVQKGDQYELR
jgi:hypothetical protein